MDVVKIALKIIEDKFSDISEPAGGPGYRVLHAKRVYKYISNIIEKNLPGFENINKKAVLAGGILHDIGDLDRIVSGNIDYSNKIDHAKSGSKIAKKELKKYGIDSNVIISIAEIIENHHNYNNDYSKEIKLVQDADLIEELGLINVWQMFLYSQYKERNLEDTIRYWNNEGYKRKKECLINCNFEFTKKIAKKRLEEMTAFFETLQKENESKDSD